jgi:hypothetical protein
MSEPSVQMLINGHRKPTLSFAHCGLCAVGWLAAEVVLGRLQPCIVLLSATVLLTVKPHTLYPVPQLSKDDARLTRLRAFSNYLP